MGNYRFKLSDMVPSAWFYMSRSRNHIKRKQTPSSSLLLSSSSNLQQHQRKSYYFSRHLSPNSHQSNEPLSKHPISNNISINFSEPPRKSSKKRRSTSRGKTSISPKCINSPFSSEQESSFHSPKTFDAMILSASRRPCHDLHIFDSVSKIDLPPIVTKPKKLQDSTNGTSPKRRVKNEQSTGPKGRVSSTGVKLRTKSPRIVSRKSVSSRTSVGEKSFAVVKSSKDPHKDFKESMVEMIVKNNIRTGKDLEDLLACYLSLNSDHYHHLIIKVFKQIWFDIQLK